MNARGGVVLVAVDLEPGAAVAVAWDGGPFAAVHAVEDGRPGIVLERWSMHDPRTGRPALPVTPEALERLTLFRLSDEAAARRLTAAARAAADELAAV